MNHTHSVQAEKLSCHDEGAPDISIMSPSFDHGAHLATLIMIALALVAACLDDSLIKKEILKGAHPAACGLCTVGMSWLRRMYGERELGDIGSSRITFAEDTNSPPERELKQRLRFVPRVTYARISRSAGIGAQDGHLSPLSCKAPTQGEVSILKEVAG